VSAANAILDRGYGKPAQSVDLTSRNVHAEDLIAVIQESRKEAIRPTSGPRRQCGFDLGPAIRS
jgi:hypothetical protein